MKIRTLIFVILFSTNFVLSQNKITEDSNNIYIDLEEYKINNQSIDSIPYFDFKYAIIDSELNSTNINSIFDSSIIKI